MVWCQCRFISDQVIGLLQSLASGMLLSHKHFHSQAPDREPLPPPMFPGNYANATEVCIRDAEMHALLDSTEVRPCTWMPAAELLQVGCAGSPEWQEPAAGV